MIIYGWYKLDGIVDGEIVEVNLEPWIETKGEEVFNDDGSMEETSGVSIGKIRVVIE
jgi:hypothetical protein